VNAIAVVGQLLGATDAVLLTPVVVVDETGKMAGSSSTEKRLNGDLASPFGVLSKLLGV
jgi:hypothetical protein